MQPKSSFLSRLALLLVAALCLVLLPATSAAAATFATAPVPTITGTAKIASTLTANPGTWTPLPSFTYQWKRGGTAITGATAATYKPAAADAGTTLTVTVTGTKTGYTTVSKTSLHLHRGACSYDYRNSEGRIHLDRKARHLDPHRCVCVQVGTQRGRHHRCHHGDLQACHR
jgi:hypothetical protein